MVTIYSTIYAFDCTNNNISTIIHFIEQWLQLIVPPPF
ncbi:hypothetical protein CZ794_05310 [Psychrobacter sp. JB385]|nr:hypothetical protein CZ794_05310 [Psychrobacter sp. JB385]